MLTCNVTNKIARGQLTTNSCCHCVTGIQIVMTIALCRHVQITAIMLAPAFPGVLVPLHFSPVRFEEFAGFAATLCGTWVGAALLMGAYRRDSTSGAAFGL